MAVEKLNPVLAAADLAGAADFWETLLQISPTFVDGERWAQFDVGPTRIALAGCDWPFEDVAIMLKVADIQGEVDRLSAAGIAISGVEAGAHELQAALKDPSGRSIILYQPQSPDRRPGSPGASAPARSS